MNNSTSQFPQNATDYNKGVFGTFTQITGGILTLIVIVSNGFCFLVTYQSKRIKFVTRILFNSLLFANLYIGFGLGIPQFILLSWGHLIKLSVATKICRISTGVSLTGSAASVFSLFLINMERYLAIEMPLRYASIVTWKRAAIMNVVKWLGVVCVTLIYGFHFAESTHYSVEFQICYPNFSTNYRRSFIIVVLYMFLMLLVPAITTICIYIRILIIVHKRLSMTNMTTSNSAQGKNSKHQCNRKAICTFLTVFITYMTTWLPICALNLFMLIHENNFYPYLLMLIWLNLLCSHWISIAVYIGRNQSFKEAKLVFFKKQQKKCVPSALNITQSSESSKRSKQTFIGRKSLSAQSVW